MANKTKYASLRKVEVELNPTNKVIATMTRNESNKTIRVDIRHWYLPDDSAEYIATSKGVSLPIDKALNLLQKLVPMVMEPIPEEVSDVQDSTTQAAS